MERLQNTAIATQDISSIYLAATYTADADRELLVCLYLSGLAGNGVYRACTTKQIGGTGSAYQSGTAAIPVATGVTTCMFETTPVAVQDGDVLVVYCQGLAADTSVSGAVEVFDVTATATGITAQEVRDALKLAPSAGAPDPESIDYELDAIGTVVVTNLDAAVSTRAVAGDEMLLQDGAISGDKFDNSTAFPITATDAGDTYIARTGADGDTLETLSDQIDGIAAGGMAGAGSYTFTYTVTDSSTSLPIDGCEVWVTTDINGVNIIAAGWTDTFGQVVFYLDPGTYYIFRRLSGYSFSPQPDTEIVGD